MVERDDVGAIAPLVGPVSCPPSCRPVDPPPAGCISPLCQRPPSPPHDHFHSPPPLLHFRLPAAFQRPHASLLPRPCRASPSHPPIDFWPLPYSTRPHPPWLCFHTPPAAHHGGAKRPQPPPTPVGADFTLHAPDLHAPPLPPPPPLSTGTERHAASGDAGSGGGGGEMTAPESSSARMSTATAAARGARSFDPAAGTRLRWQPERGGTPQPPRQPACQRRTRGP